MALGGGTFTHMNKELPGTYMNFISNQPLTSNFGERGKVAIAIRLNWGKLGEFTKVTKENFKEISQREFGVPFDYYYLQPIRDVLKHSKECYVYRLEDSESNSGVKASNEYATALYTGVDGNRVSIEITQNLDGGFVVNTYRDNTIMDTQVVTRKEELHSNDFVEFNSNLTLQKVSKTPLANGKNGGLTNKAHTEFMAKCETIAVNCIVANTLDDDLKRVYVEHNKHCREELGIKFQTVMYNYDADYEGVVNVCSKPINVVNDSIQTENYLTFAVAGMIGGCPVNMSCTNMVYDGELEVLDDKSQDQLITSIKKGQFVFHRVNDKIRVLKDINSLQTITETKGDIFKDNKVIRIIDIISQEVANTFNNNFVGKVANDKSGRVSLWNEVSKIFEELETRRAIEDFDNANIVIEQGNDRNSVVITTNCKIIGTMEQLYMTTTIE